nr:hypothetical protein [Deltaproteobacteria bacterium]
APARERDDHRQRNRTIAYTSLGIAGVAGVTALATGFLAYRAKSDFDGTDVQRDARDAKERYDRYLPIAIGSGALAIGAGAVAYWLWPKSETRVVPTASSEGAGISVAVPW